MNTALPWNIKRITENGKSFEISTGIEYVRVAIIDSGIDYHHDLFGNIDLENSYNFLDDNTNVIDLNGHGTMVAGIIASKDLNIGLAPDVSLLICKITDSDKFLVKNMLKALKYAIDQRVDVINLSLSAYIDPDNNKEAMKIFEELIKKAQSYNILIVASSGNHGLDLRDEKMKLVPGSGENVIRISALTSDGEITSYSNYGDIHFTAPGGEWFLNNLDPSKIITTACPKGQANLKQLQKNLGYKDGLTINFGTSLAAAHATGAIAIIISHYFKNFNEKPTYSMVIDYLRNGAKQIGEHKYYGQGEINIYNSLKSIDLK